MSDTQTTPAAPTTSRRNFLRSGVQVAAGMGAFVTALKPLADFDMNTLGGIEGFLQKHYKEMDAEDMADALGRIQADVERRFDLDPTKLDEQFSVRDIKPKEGVEFVYALNLSRCIGCRKCVHACVQENNQGRGDGAGGGSPEIQYIRVLEMPKGTLDVEKGNHHYDRPTVPDRDHFYMPI